MATTAPEHRPVLPQDELDALIKEARQRQQRRRRRMGFSFLAVVAVALVAFGLGGAGGATKSHRSRLRPAISSATNNQAVGAATLSNVESVDFLNADTGWVLTSTPSTDGLTQLLATVDAGRRWTNISPPTLRGSGRVVDGMLLSSRTDLWVGVSNNSAGPTEAELFNSTDGGRTWSDRGVFPHGGGSVWPYFISPSRGWLMVDNGAAAGSDWVTIYRTTSAGRHWALIARTPFPGVPDTSGTPGAPSSGCDKLGIAFASSTSGWIGQFCASGVALQRSIDGGRQWSEANLDTTDEGGFATAPRFFNGADGAASAGLGAPTGTRGAIFTTIDGGTQWTLHKSPGFDAAPADIVSPTMWFTYKGDTLFVTRNAGATWSSHRSPVVNNSFDGQVLDFINVNDGWVVTHSGRLWHTTNGGRSWKRS
jgi:photosystem II stability/assembly factor-like uncharacterized protein